MGSIVSVMTGPPRQARKLGVSGQTSYTICRTDAGRRARPGGGAMDVVVERCAGLDVHRDTVVATVRGPGKGRGGRSVQTRTFATTTAGLLALGDWLVEHGVQRAGMESTGVYWKRHEGS